MSAPCLVAKIEPCLWMFALLLGVFEVVLWMSDGFVSS